MAAVERVVDASLWSVFTAKAELVGAAVMRTASQDTALTLLGEATSGFACTASASKRYPELDRHAARGSAEPEVEAARGSAEHRGRRGRVVCGGRNRLCCPGRTRGRPRRVLSGRTLVGPG